MTDPFIDSFVKAHNAIAKLSEKQTKYLDVLAKSVETEVNLELLLIVLSSYEYGLASCKIFSKNNGLSMFVYLYIT